MILLFYLVCKCLPLCDVFLPGWLNLRKKKHQNDVSRGNFCMDATPKRNETVPNHDSSSKTIFMVRPSQSKCDFNLFGTNFKKYVFFHLLFIAKYCNFNRI